MSKIIDSGDFHQILEPNNETFIELYPDIPKCFKMDLRELDSPLTLNVKQFSSTNMFHTSSGHDNTARHAIKDDEADINLYGSFKCSEPNKDNFYIH